jgi:hypothetical protein
MDAGIFWIVKFFAVSGVILTRYYLKSRSRVEPRDQPDRPVLALEGPQIAGSRCAVCAKNIVFHTQGRYCDCCKQPMHLECLTRHQTESVGPYR